MKYYELEKEEQEILDSLEKGSFKSVKNKKAEISTLKSATVNTLNKNRNINIRISERDFQKTKSVAMRDGIPYQTLISSVIRKFLSNQ